MSLTKNAKDNPVTSIADTDLVMCSVNGVYHPISFADLMNAVRGGIQVGGRNLLKYANFYNRSTNTVVNGGSITINDNADTFFRILCVNPSQIALEEQYTLSFDVSGMIDGNSWGMRAFVNTPNEVSVSMKNGRNQVTFAMKQVSEYVVFDDGARIFTNGFSPITLSNFKLERGNIATDWSPAPEDIVSGSWGGVIGYLPITYGVAEKGGSHESDKNTCGQAELGADSYLAFGSLDAACECIGRVCSSEWKSYSADTAQKQQPSGRCGSDMYHRRCRGARKTTIGIQFGLSDCKFSLSANYTSSDNLLVDQHPDSACAQLPRSLMVGLVSNTIRRAGNLIRKEVAV